ncbi:hypothetical protein BpHYR1_035149 [Brachionus plicatilis]|uniref:Uncharacterized protein n=1 Tax=Brachionus plicatilis TaxID=10195 RepID=A0A3M7SE77_BRAPC|nr:hypothetical protein BpHYR1_035149 [Brachionus plicatilis]
MKLIVYYNSSKSQFYNFLTKIFIFLGLFELSLIEPESPSKEHKFCFISTFSPLRPTDIFRMRGRK